jgi:hypothetical protein
MITLDSYVKGLLNQAKIRREQKRKEMQEKVQFT